MATAEQEKDKKKNRLRGLFALSQTASEEGEVAQADPMSSSDSPFRCTENSTSRIKRILFKRSASEDRTRNLRVKSLSPTTKSHDELLPSLANRSHEASAALPLAIVTDSLNSDRILGRNLDQPHPKSPPPSYEQQGLGLERSSTTSLPPTYDEAVARSYYATPPVVYPTHQFIDHDQGANLDYCTCLECQARYSALEEQEREDNGNDAVFPMETHVLMQEVLADGMAFCSLM